MSKEQLTGGFAVAIFLALAGSALVAGAEAPTAAEQEATAIGAVKQMSRHLTTLGDFTVKSSVSIDEVLESGQKIQLDQQLEIRAKRPGSLWAIRKSPRGDVLHFYDGKTFTVYADGLDYYASFDAPDTIRKTVVAAEERGIDWPLADLFLWGTDEDAIDAVQSAIVVGTTEINGVSVNQYAFHQEEVDWQIWIAREGDPLPMKLVITSRQEEGQPQYTSVMEWDTSPDLSKQQFTFKPGANDHRIAFEGTADAADEK